MTRINAPIAPAELCDKHLLAENHEMPRVFTLAIQFWQMEFLHRGAVLPQEPRLGQGHVKFYYSFMPYLAARLRNVQLEMEHRGFSPDFSLSDKIQKSLDILPMTVPLFPEEYIEQLKQRILQTVSFGSRWTKRPVPSWVLTSLSHPLE